MQLRAVGGLRQYTHRGVEKDLVARQFRARLRHVVSRMREFAAEKFSMAVERFSEVEIRRF